MKTLKLMSSKQQTMVMNHSNIIHTVYIIVCIANRSRWKTFAVCRIEVAGKLSWLDVTVV